jgi:hypothetical protein
MREVIARRDRSQPRRSCPPSSPPGRPRNLVGARSARSSRASQRPTVLYTLPGRRDRARSAAHTLLGVPRLAVTLPLPAACGGQAC